MAKRGIFNNPIAPTERSSSKNFASPTRDQLSTGRFMPCGDYYGTGFKAPVGKMRGDGAGQRPVPMKSLCFSGKETLA